MTMHQHESGATSGTPPFPREVPPRFVSVAEVLPPALDRTLGYRGDGRFVSFRYEARGQEVVWADGRSHGFGTGGWQAFDETVAPLAERYGVNVGSDRAAARDALVLDRATGSAYFARHENAERFLARVAATR